MTDGIDVTYVYDELRRMNFSNLSSRPLEKEEWAKIDELIARASTVSLYDKEALIKYAILWREWAPFSNREVIHNCVFTSFFIAWQNLTLDPKHKAINDAIDTAMRVKITPAPDLVDKSELKRRDKRRGKK